MPAPCESWPPPSPPWPEPKASKLMRVPWRFVLPNPTPRKSVQAMAPYSPPTGNRRDKLRLDFNENTMGCSPRVIEALRAALDAGLLTVYPDYAKVKATLAAHFRVSPDELLLTNGTDEAIQILVNTYVDAGDEVLTLRPSYAMYRFYCEVAGANIVEV